MLGCDERQVDGVSDSFYDRKRAHNAASLRHVCFGSDSNGPFPANYAPHQTPTGLNSLVCDRYGVKGRVHKLEQRKVWNVGLEHLPNRDSFDVEFSPSGQVLRKTTYNMAGAVIGSVHFLYDDSGKTSSSLEFDGAGKQIHRNDFVHDDLDLRPCRETTVDIFPTNGRESSHNGQ
jgi:hypothetical protein